MASITPRLPNNFMTKFFLAHVALELHQSPDAIQDHMKDLSVIFPDSSYIKSQRAMACYNLRGLLSVYFCLCFLSTLPKFVYGLLFLIPIMPKNRL